MQRTHDRVQSLAPTLALSREPNSLASDPQTCAEAFANLTCNFPARRTLSRPLASAARRRAATLAPAARCTFDPQPSFEPMTDREEPVMTHDITLASEGWCKSTKSLPSDCLIFDPLCRRSISSPRLGRLVQFHPQSDMVARSRSTTPLPNLSIQVVL